MKSKTVERSVAGPRKRKSIVDETAGPGRLVVVPTPNNCTRTDKTGHWPCFRDQKSRCIFCKKGIFRTSCMKCQVYLFYK